MATYYIDGKNGKSTNSGLSEKEPLNTNKGLEIKPGDRVLFKRGNFVRDALFNLDGEEGNPTYYGAYGEGENPVFCGSVDVSNTEKWTETEKNIWKYDGVLQTEVCNIVFANGECGNFRWEKEEITEQGDFWDNCFGFSNAQKECENHTLLLYSKENPAIYYGHIECVLRVNRQLAKNGHDMIIENLTFINNGVHAVAGECASKNLTIRNCKFEKIGGSAWSKDLKIRFGNGVECWDIGDNITVENCIFNDIYDSAVTHQGGGSTTKPAYNFIIKNNIFIKCGMAAYEQRDKLPEYAVFNNNICIDAGEGFSKNGVTMPRKSEIWPQPMGHHIFLWRIENPTPDAHFEIKNNVFGNAPYGGAIYSIIKKEPDEQIDIENNVYNMEKRELLNRYFGKNYNDLTCFKEETKKDVNGTEI